MSKPILQLFNTESKEKEKVYPSNKKYITLYTCGPTVYDFAHIGNFRTYIFEDLLRRTLLYFGYEIKQVMNITDVDDKTIKGAIKKHITLEEYTKPFKKAFFEDLKTLNIEKAEEYPEATKYIPQMIKMIAALLEKKVAYEKDGSVYFSIADFPSYGRLSHLKLDELQHSKRVTLDEYDKENLSDFVLWKAYDKERDGDIYWDSPFGKGRPGWHIECSAMSMELLGETIDLHCGGVDNIFPHHENEIAQSEALTGVRFVYHWVHAEHLIVDGKKMSKSLGNFYTLRDLLEKGYSGDVVRYALLCVHYRTQLNFTFDSLECAKASLQRLRDFICRLEAVEKDGTEGIALSLIEKAHDQFITALADDLNISMALASVFDLIREIHSLLDQEKISKNEAEKLLSFLKEIDQVIGCIPFEKQCEDIPKEVLLALEQREKARKEKNFKEADRLRDHILSMGYQIEDSKKGPRLKKTYPKCTDKK